MLIDTMFGRDMYQVYEINGDWYSRYRADTDVNQSINSIISN